MAASPDAGAAALRSIIRGLHLAGPEDVPRLAVTAGAHLGAVETLLYSVDYGQVLLVPFGVDGARVDAAVPVEGTLAGRAFAEVALVQAGGDGRRTTVWVPLVDGAERLGVVEFVFPDGVEVTDSVRADCRDVAGLLAEALMTRSLYGDAIEKGRRVRPMTLPAEMQWRQLPPLTYVGARVAVAGVLEPAEAVAGDGFDYAINGDCLHAAVIDAMGHGLEATLLSVVAIGALRNARRRELTLSDTVAAMNAAIAGHFAAKFVTGIVGELDLRTGGWTWITCGHPPALLIRNGQVVKTLDQVVSPPLGLQDTTPAIGTEQLQPGDRLLLYTDGVTEARDTHGGLFGTDRLVQLVTTEAAAARPAAETLRRLNLAILTHQAGTLQDDATTMLIEYRTNQADRSIP